MSIGQRVREERVAKGWTQPDLAKRAGITQPSLSEIETGETKQPEGKTLIALAMALEVRPEYLQTGKLPKDWGRPVGRATGSAPYPVAEEGRDVIEIPIFDAAGSMGEGIAVHENDSVIDHLRLTGTWVRRNLPNVSSTLNLSVISALGDSMMPTFNDGDILLVDTGIKAVDRDGVFVLRANDRLYIKRVRQRIRDGAFEVSSDNSTAGTPEELQGREQIDVLGKVVWAWNGKRL